MKCEIHQERRLTSEDDCFNVTWNWINETVLGSLTFSVGTIWREKRSAGFHKYTFINLRAYLDLPAAEHTACLLNHLQLKIWFHGQHWVYLRLLCRFYTKISCTKHCLLLHQPYSRPTFHIFFKTQSVIPGGKYIKKVFVYHVHVVYCYNKMRPFS